MNAASPRQSLVKGERLTRYELAAVMKLKVEAGLTQGNHATRCGSGRARHRNAHVQTIIPTTLNQANLSMSQNRYYTC